MGGNEGVRVRSSDRDNERGRKRGRGKERGGGNGGTRERQRRLSISESERWSPRLAPTLLRCWPSLALPCKILDMLAYIVLLLYIISDTVSY